jgi:MarR family transcriptional regulator, organic hydroperoxide resistance regulator
MADDACCGARPPDLEGVDEVALRVYEAWGRTLHLQRQLALKVLPDKSLHPAQARCLWAISSNHDITQRDLADLLHLSRPTVTAMLQRMEKAGLVERRSDPVDHRLTRIRVTAAGTELDAGMREFHRSFINATIGCMSTADQEEFERLLGIVRHNIESALGSHSPAREDVA